MMALSRVTGSTGCFSGIDSISTGSCKGSIVVHPLKVKITNKMIIITTTGFNK
tara:strand:+ start:495 stop:653 length:159 start_codon:yes stop_codon:yes gene_type:complete